MGFWGALARKGSSSKTRNKPVSRSRQDGDKQVLEFQKSIKGDGKDPDMSRDLFSVPRSEKIETMAEHLAGHKEGDLFPYLAVTGVEEEAKDSRLSRLRAFRSPYGKENKPEMRINGVVLDEVEGTIMVQSLKEYVDSEKLSRSEARQNRKFRPLQESSFKKPYLQISRITGEFVPLMSSTSDYTELYFTLEDGRLLDHQTIVQSNKLPTNQNGVFELSCDYCISTKDLTQLSLKYFLARPIMKDGFQWGSVSLTIRVSESDTPYLTPKVEAMAITRVPFTTLEEQVKDPDHADVVFTSAQISKMRDMYRSGDIVDVDEPKQEKSKTSSYSKSTIRGLPKGTRGAEHLGEMEGWSQLKDFRKPLLEEGIASESVDSEGSATPVNQITKQNWENHQEELRKHMKFSSEEDEVTPGGSDSSTKHQRKTSFSVQTISSDDSHSPPHREMQPLKPALKKSFKSPPPSTVEDVDEDSQGREEGFPDTRHVYRFD